MTTERPILRLKTPNEGDHQEEELRVDLFTFDVLLPCRRYEVAYKVAVLGNISPTLEFLLRLVKAVDGIDEEEARAFFGYSRVEMEYVLSEGTSPGYVDRVESRLWLTTSGDALFSEGGDEPAIFAVENRRSAFGFDQLSLAPQQWVSMDRMEMHLPDLSIDTPFGGSSPSKAVEGRFNYFFRELGDKADRERSKRRNLYSIDGVTPGDRFQTPVRINVFCRVSTPSVGEIDLAAWRPDQEMTDRPEIEKAVGEFVADLTVPRIAQYDDAAYRVLTELAPDFFKEYMTANGLSVHRFWRYAASHSGETRVDRKTIPLAGSLLTRENMEKALRIVDAGLKRTIPPEVFISVPCVRKYWGATTLTRELNALLRTKLRKEGEDGATEPDAICIFVDKVPKYVNDCFDVVVCVDTMDLPQSLELQVIPGIAVIGLVHAPLGANHGLPVPLGFASFDPKVLKAAEDMVADKVCRFITRDVVRDRLDACLSQQHYQTTDAEPAPETADVPSTTAEDSRP